MMCVITNFSFLLQILLKLGIVIYTALDYNLPQDEECILSPDLEHIINLMTFEGEFLAGRS